MRIWAMLACMAAAMWVIYSAHAETRIQLLGTWPTGDAVTLHRRQNFYLHLHYTSDEPVHIWARPYFEGKAVNAGSNPSRVYPTGGGEALGWFFLIHPGAQVDEVRISAGDGSFKGTNVVARYPIAVMGDDEPTLALPPPAWVSTLRAADEAAQRADYERSMKTPASTSDLVLFNGFMLAMTALGLTGLAWPAWALRRWRGGWRIAATVPAAIMTFVVLRILIGTALDPTSHNLWPFEIVMWGGFSCLWMLIAGLMHRLSGAGRT